MNKHLPANREPGGEAMRVSVAGEKQQLEDKHAGGPYGRRTAEKWKQLLAQQQLHLEDQERAEEDRRGKRKLSSAVARLKLRCGGNDFALRPRDDRSFDDGTHGRQSV